MQVEFRTVLQPFSDGDVAHFRLATIDGSVAECLCLFVANVILRDPAIAAGREVVQVNDGVLSFAVLLVSLGHRSDYLGHFAELVAEPFISHTKHHLEQAFRLAFSDEWFHVAHCINQLHLSSHSLYPLNSLLASSNAFASGWQLASSRMLCAQSIAAKQSQ